MAKLNLFKEKPVTKEDLGGIKGFLSNENLEEGYYPLNTVGFGAKKYAGYVVYINSDGNALDIIQEGEMPSHQVEIENIKKKEQQQKYENTEIAKRAAQLNVNRKENIAKLKGLRSDSEKIDARFNDAKKRYLTARKDLEDYVKTKIKADKNRNPEGYQRQLRELQDTAEYKLLAQDEIGALKRFFKQSNALSGLSEELASGDQNYQPIDYNKKVQDIVTEPAGFFGTMAGKTRRIPEGDPGSIDIDRNRIRDYKSGESSPSQELERQGKAIERGKETIERGGNMLEASKVAMETKLSEPEKTPYDTFSTDQLIELLIKENKKKTGK